MTPHGYSVRPPTEDDAPGVLALVVACDIEEFGEPDYSMGDVMDGWRRIGFDLGRDAIAVEDRDGSIVGYTDVHDRQEHMLINPNACVHPEHRGRGIGAFLLGWAERRGREIAAAASPGEAVRFQVAVSSVNERGRELVEARGYRVARSFWRMEIEMEEEPEAPVWPEGIEVRSFRSGDERAVHAAVEEAFRDTEGQLPRSYEDWEQTMLGRDDFDPSLWFLAVDGDEIAGTSLCLNEEDVGWVRQLTVRRPWRRRGLGLALLRHSFREYHRRGMRRVGLSVDSRNSTGATRLYERAGMRVAWQYDFYEKTVEAG